MKMLDFLYKYIGCNEKSSLHYVKVKASYIITDLNFLRHFGHSTHEQTTEVSDILKASLQTEGDNLSVGPGTSVNIGDTHLQGRKF